MLLVSRKVNNSASTSYGLDKLYRTTKIDYPSGTDDVNFSYYKNDNPKQVTRGSTTWNYLYDLNNNLTQEKLTISTSSPSFPAARTYTIDYGYDTRDSIKTIEYPGGLEIDVHPNAFGRPTRISAKVAGLGVTDYATSVAHYPNGQLEEITFGNGLTTNYGQDERLRPTTFSVVNSGSSLLLDREYKYDATGNVEKIEDYLIPSNDRDMTYDGLGRLRTASGSWGSGSISYDARNNILTKIFGSDSLTLQYDTTKNRLSSVTGAQSLSYSYDVYGNVISSGRSSFGNYEYDDGSQLRWIRNSSNVDQIEYRHDGNRRTVLERYVDGSATKYKAYGLSNNLMHEEDLANGYAKDYIYLGSRLIADRFRCTSTTDSDSDGLSNCVEYQHGLDKDNAADAGQDADGDGASNATEIQAGTNINDIDTDGDGMEDGYEITHNLDPLSDDADLDADNDGLTNLQEYQHGTDPNNADTDGDGIDDGADPDPLFNPAILIPIFSLILS